MSQIGNQTGSKKLAYPIEWKREAIKYFKDNKATISLLDAVKKFDIPVSTMKKFRRNRMTIMIQCQIQKSSHPKNADVCILGFLKGPF